MLLRVAGARAVVQSMIGMGSEHCGDKEFFGYFLALSKKYHARWICFVMLAMTTRHHDERSEEVIHGVSCRV